MLPRCILFHMNDLIILKLSMIIFCLLCGNFTLGALFDGFKQGALLFNICSPCCSFFGHAAHSGPLRQRLQRSPDVVYR